MALFHPALVFIFLLIPYSGSAQSVCTYKEIETEVYIAASCQEVWNMLIQVENYKNWHPYITEISGELFLGNRIKVSAINTDSSTQTFSAYILELQPGEQLAWGGSLGFLFSAKHYFILEPADNNSTHFIQGEYWRGWFGRAYGKRIYEETCFKFELMNQRMKEMLEMD
jgi:hypothetical protein